MDLSYPIGKFPWSVKADPSGRAKNIAEIESAAGRFRDAVRGLNEEQLDTVYRPGGWTVRQVIHHMPDSHMNAFIRFRLALTEEEPAVKPYDEAKWADLADSRSAPVEISLQLLESLHSRWVRMMQGMSDSDFLRTMRHPKMGILDLETTLGGYAWHSRHHAAHITGLRDRMGWK